jgi:hypothetical protein
LVAAAASSIFDPTATPATVPPTAATNLLRDMRVMRFLLIGAW